MNPRLFASLFLETFCAVFCGLQCPAADQRITITVTDADSGKAIAARLYLTAENNLSYYLQVASAGASAVKYEKQNWLDKNSVEYHTTVSAHPCFASVPSGRYTLIVEHGKTYRPVTQSIELGDQDIELKIPLQRWSDPSAVGWYSGDTHLHRTVDELRNVLLAEDLECCFTADELGYIRGQATRKRRQEHSRCSVVIIDRS